MRTDTLKSFFASDPPLRRFLSPEVVQTSAMDCGPATLKCMLEGFGIPVSYGRLREACQTDVDGTSIDVMEDVANQLGLEAEQIMVPADHLLLPETQTLPAIVIVRLPSGLTHFVVAWRVHGRFVQIMDPGSGRRWRTDRRFLSELYIHTHPVPADAWREWAGTEGFCDPMRSCMKHLGMDETGMENLIRRACEDPGWHSLAALDASIRMTGTIVRAGGLRPGAEAAGVLTSFFDRCIACKQGESAVIPESFWSVRPSPDEPDTLVLKGAVLVRVLGRRGETAASQQDSEEVEHARRPLSPELVAALEEKTTRPEIEIFRILRKDGFLTPAVLLLAMLLSVIGITIEALLLRGLMDIGQKLEPAGQRAGAVTALFIFVISLLLLELPIASAMLRIGRRFETRLRIAFLRKIPRLGDRYFHSRLTSDMTQRVYELRGLRMLPGLGVSFIRLCFQIAFTAAGVVFFVPASAGLAILATGLSVGITLVSQPLLQEQDLRLRTHVAALSRFYLDALLGLIPIRTHCAERPVMREHESLLVEWVRTHMDFLKTETVIAAVEALTGVLFSIWILFSYIGNGGEPSGALLLFYWALNLPVLGKNLAALAQQYPMHRNRVLRILEPLGAPEESDIVDENEVSQEPGTEPFRPVAIAMEQAGVQAGGRIILKDINLKIRAGEHIAIVGPSGAGKSSLAGLLLGWHRPSSGKVLADGRLLRGEELQKLRHETVWVDPEVRIWNRSLFENLQYGNANGLSGISEVVEESDLFNVLEKLPEGMQTRLGEGGGLVSGGEGQRVRLGRAMLKSRVRLVILDEPFRGLDREKRRELLVRARRHWKDATLLFISHDVGEAMGFDRVLVIEQGGLAEDDRPSVLAEKPDSRFRALLNSEAEVRKGLWESTAWRRLWLEDGKLSQR